MAVTNPHEIRTDLMVVDCWQLVRYEGFKLLHILHECPAYHSNLVTMFGNMTECWRCGEHVPDSLQTLYRLYTLDGGNTL